MSFFTFLQFSHQIAIIHKSVKTKTHAQIVTCKYTGRVRNKGLPEAALEIRRIKGMISAVKESARDRKVPAQLKALKALTAASQGKIRFSITHSTSQELVRVVQR